MPCCWNAIIGLVDVRVFFRGPGQGVDDPRGIDVADPTEQVVGLNLISAIHEVDEAVVANGDAVWYRQGRTDRRRSVLHCRCIRVTRLEVDTAQLSSGAGHARDVGSARDRP